MNYFLRICLACLCVLGFAHNVAQAQAPVLQRATLFNVPTVNPLTLPSHPTFTDVPINTTVRLKFDEDAFRPGNVPFINGENVTALFTFTVPLMTPVLLFTATIDNTASGQWVTFVANQPLSLSSTHTIELKAGAVISAALDPNVAQDISFTTATGVAVTAPATLSLCQNGVPKVLGNIVITEGSDAGFGQGTAQTFELDAPVGFAFVAGIGSVTETGSDVSNASLTVTASKIILQYDVNTSYADNDAITIQNVQVVWVSGTGTQLLKRTGGTAAQAGNRIADAVTHATFGSTALPTSPTPANYTLASGFGLLTNLTPAFTVVSGSLGRFYNSSNLVTPVYTSPASTGTINVTLTNLGYLNDNTAGTITFYMSVITGTCESVKVPFTVTIGTVPQMSVVSLYNANNIPLPTNATTLSAATYDIPTNTTIIIDFSEPIFSTSAVAFTNTTIDNIFDLEETATAVAVAGADATIIGQRVIITSPELKAATSYTIRLKANNCQSNIIVRNLVQTIIFTTATATAVTAPTLSLCRNGVPEVLGNIVIEEGSVASFGQGTNQLFEMNAPAGFAFVAGTGSVTTTGSDVSSANVFVTASKITLIYSVNSTYADINIITIQNVQVNWVPGTGSGTLLRAATSNANQANNGSPSIYATFTSTVVPSTPTLSGAFTSGNLNVCSGFSIASTTNFAVASGNTAKFYDITNGLPIHTIVSASSFVSVSFSQLGYTLANNTILGTKQFYITTTDASGCESAKRAFTITNNPLPTVTLINGAMSFCQGDAVTFDAVGTTPANYLFQLSQNNFATAPLGVSTASSYSPSLAAGTYQLRVRATNSTTNCESFSGPITFTVTGTLPTVTFVWTGAVSYADNIVVGVNLSDVAGTFGGRVGALFNQPGGVYSGAGVTAGKFYPNAAGVGTHIITYTYTSGVCVASATVTFTVFSNNNPILNLSTTYCIESGISGTLTPNPAVGGGATPIAPNGIPQGLVVGLPYIDDNFFFPNSVPNVGVEWNGTQYKFNPASANVAALFGVSDSFVDITLTIATFAPFSPGLVICNHSNFTVRVYRVLSASMSVSLANAQAFCDNDTDFVVNPLINGVPPPIGSTSTIEYRQGVAAFAPFTTPNTIEPSSLSAGTYDMRFTYFSPQGCTNTITRTFIIRATPAPSFTIRSASGAAIISSACTNGTLVRLLSPAFVGTGVYTISKLPFSTTYNAVSGGLTNIFLTDLVGAGTYNITLTVTNGICIGTTTVQTLEIVPTPVADFSFAPLIPLPIVNTLSICQIINSFTLYPNNASLPAGNGFFNIRKTTGGAFGKNFAVGTNTFDPLTDFDVASGMGAGTYEIKYIYTTTAGACADTSDPKLLTITPKPDVDVNLLATQICRNPIMPTIGFTTSWSNQGSNPFILANSVIKIYASNGTTLLQTLTGVTSINPNTLITSSIAITEFKVEYQYTDALGCVGTSPTQKSFFVNPLPAPAINFANPTLNSFCYASSSLAVFDVFASGANVTMPFDPSNGFITIRNNPASVPATTPYLNVLANGVDNFNVSAELGTTSNRVGEYFIDYTYTDTKGCSVTVTSPTNLIYNFYSSPDFLYPFNATAYTICETTTSLALRPFLYDNTQYGTDPSIVNSRGTYVITKPGFPLFSASFNGGATGLTDTFDPNALIVNAPNGGAGTYNIKYNYTSARGCGGEGFQRQLTIKEKPALTFSFLTNPAEVCNKTVRDNITIVPTWTNRGVRTFVPGSGKVNIYTNVGTVPILTLTAGDYVINPNNAAISILINASAITEFKVDFEYLDNDGCLGTSPKQSFFINPLPAPTSIAFTNPTLNNFCLSGTTNADFTVSVAGVNVGTFAPANGRITLRANTASLPATPANSFVLAAGIVIFNPSSIVGIQAGEYFIDYRYTDTKGCETTVTCPTRLLLNFDFAPNFNFPGNVPTLSICENATTLALTPLLPNTTGYGTDPSVVNARGTYTFTKGAFTRIFTGTTTGTTDTFNPFTLLTNPAATAAGGGVGTYDVQYSYTSARTCTRVSIIKQLIINKLPALDFTFAPVTLPAVLTKVCNNSPVRPTIDVIPSWTDIGSNTFMPLDGRFKIYNSTGTTLIHTLSPGDNTINPNVSNISTLLIGATTIIEFKAEFEYTNNNGCLGTSPKKSFFINPIPAPTIAFLGTNIFCQGDATNPTFMLGVSGINATPFAPLSGFLTARANNASVPPTFGVIPSFPAGQYFISLASLSPGEYFIDYTYTDTENCSKTVTCSTLLIVKTRPTPSFAFPVSGSAPNYTICETATSVVLTPSIPLSTPVLYGADNALTNARGTYTFTRGAFTTTFAGTTQGATDIFNPQTLLLSVAATAAGGGVGTYNVTYTYNTLLGCTGTSVVQTLTINPTPVLTFSFAPLTGEICNDSPVRPDISITPTWTNAGVRTFQSVSGQVRVYTSTNVLILTLPFGNYTIDPNNSVIVPFISATAVTEFKADFIYTDNNGCVGTSPKQSFFLNPVSIPTISFIGASDFCQGDTNNPTFSLGAIGVNNAPFVPAASFMTIRPNNGSSPGTFGAIIDLPIGQSNIILSTLGVGEYFIDYTYKDIKGCIKTSTCATLLKIKAVPEVSFKFPTNASSYTICENETTLELFPTLSNAGLYGVGTFDITKGRYIITKGAFTWPVTATNTFNPRTLLFQNVNGGAGVYTIKYQYTSSVPSCVGESPSVPVQTLTIFPLPAPAFSFVGGDNSFCENELSISVIPLVNGVTPTTPGNGYFTITKTAPVAGLPTRQSDGINQFNIAVLLTGGLGTYSIFYTYRDASGCNNTTIPQSFTIVPLPVTALTFPATVAFPLGDNAFCENETTATVNITYAGIINPLTSFIKIIKDGVIIPLAAGVNTFNPSLLASNLATGVGLYTITHTYTDGNSCEKETAPITFNIYSLPVPTFDFQTVGGPPTFSVCANITSVALFPDISNANSPGVGAFAGALGYFTIRKAGALVVQLANGVSSFNPNTPPFTSSVGGLVGGYEIRYTYKTANGCEQTTPAGNNFTINPLPTSDFTFVLSSVAELNVTQDIARVCASFTDISVAFIAPIGVSGSYQLEIQEIIIPTPTTLPALIIVLSTTAGTASISASDLFVAPTMTTAREFQIRLRYTNVNGCIAFSTPKTLRVVPLPATTFIVTGQKCAGLPVSFNGTSVMSPTDAAVSYLWNFNDGSATAIETTTTATNTHSFGTARTYVVSLTITSALGCSKTFTDNVEIGAIPVAGFTTANFCQGSVTTFTSTSTLIGIGNIATYDWIFDTPAVTTPPTTPIVVTTTIPNTTHTYPAPGRYLVTLKVTTDNECTDVFTKEVFIFPRITPTAAVPYKENFDSPTDNNTWFANGTIKSRENVAQDSTGYSWKRGVPTGTKVNATATTGGAWSTTGGAWSPRTTGPLVNRAGNINGFYPNERSYVESPCFNFSDPTLTKPIISMKIWYDTDRGSDGAVLYSSIDDGLTWQPVGTINEGLEWYNTAGVIGQPGGQAVVNAWTGNNLTTYKIAKFNLDQFRTKPSVRFRVAFGSNSENPVGQVFDGFAFDDVFIGNRNRISLLEHFTNASSSEANTENTFINNFPSSAPQNEIYNIQYHTNVPGADPMNADNTADPSARALFYGVSQVPRTAIDGTIENRKFSEWGTPIYNRRTLETAPFELSVDFTSTTQLLRFKANVKALEPFTRRVILQTAVVEQEILGSVFTGGNFGGLTFKNVVKGMIPNAAGTLIAQTWLQNTQFQTGELTWRPSKVYNGNRLVLVVFVQDEVTKEIYQAGFFNITTNLSSQDPTTALDPQTQSQILDNEFVVYPNPAQNQVFTGFRDETSEDFKVIIFDSYGKRIDDYSLTKGNKGLLLNTEKYASGMYFVEITGKNNIKARRKLVIAR